MTAPLDIPLLQGIITQLEEQHSRASTQTDAHHLRDAILHLRRLAAPAAIAPRVWHRWPPEPLLTEMFDTGRNTWIAELIGCTVSSARSKRRTIGVDPFDRGGSAPELVGDRERWLAEWRPKLAAAGWQPTKQAG